MGQEVTHLSETVLGEAGPLLQVVLLEAELGAPSELQLALLNLVELLGARS